VDLARMLGVSHATVSFVLNGLAEKKKISNKTAQRVLAAAQKHNYIPNQMARNLKNRRSGMIGVIAGNFKMDWIESAVEGMQSVIDQTDLVLFVATHAFETERARKEIHSSLYRRDEGVITLPLPGCEALYEKIVQSGVPLVFLGDEIPGLEGISSVMWDSRAAAEVGLRHLVDLGRKRIAFLGADYPVTSTFERLETYRRVLRESGLRSREEWVANPPANLTPQEIASRALDQFFAVGADAPDAIFTLNDGLALPTLVELEARGLSVPEDIAIIGMGNLPLTGYPPIGLTTLHEPLKEMGALAVEILLDLSSGKIEAPIRRRIISTELLVRRSTVGNRQPR
jgi:LacI family transcriptional regulator